MEIIRGVIPCAKKVVIYGPEGIGKSTFASKFPDPVFIDTEGSTNSMDVARLPKQEKIICCCWISFGIQSGMNCATPQV